MSEKNNNPRVIDLFCGAGGLSKGFDLAGFNIVAGVDKRESYLKTFRKNHDSIAIKSNLMEKKPKELFKENNLNHKNIDVVIGGPPCKGFSIAGKRNPNDQRNNLVDKFIDYVEYIKPRVFLMENVPGILSMEDGKILKLIIKRFKNIEYEKTKHKVLNAADYGVPQKRKRAIFIGRIDEKAPKFPKRTHSPKGQATITGRKLKSYVTVKDAILDKDISNLPNHEKTNHSERMKERISKVKPGESLYESYGDSWVRLEKDEPSKTIKENHNAPFIHPTKNRVGTVRECAILQSFPEDFKFEGSKSKQLKQVGNAVPPLMAKKIAEKIKEQIKKKGEG